MRRIISHRRAFLAGLLLPLTCALAAACTSTAGSSGQSGDSNSAGNSGSGAIVLGASVPQSGASGASGAKELQGMQLAVDEINAKGGINGRKLTLMAEDDESNPSTGIALVSKFKQAGAVAIMGTYNTPVVLGMSDAVKSAGIPLLTAAVSSTITDQHNPDIYQVNIIDRDQMKRAGQEIAKAGLKRVSVLADSTSLGDSGVPIAQSVFSGEGLSISSVERFDVSSPDLSPVVFRAKNAGAQALYVYTVGPATGTLMKGVRQAGFDGPVWGSGAASDPAVLQAGGTAVNGLRYTDFVDPSKPQYKTFAAAFMKKFGNGPINNFSASAYDMVYAVAGGLQKGGGNTAADVVKGLNSYSSKSTVTGSVGATYAFTADNHEALGSSAVVVKEYQNGQIVAVQ